MEKIALAKQYSYPGHTDVNGNPSPDVSFVLTANGNRPNGGILTRGPAGVTIPIIGLTFGNPRPPTPSIRPSTSFASTTAGPINPNPLNPFAEVNSLFGQLYLHVNYDQVDMSQARKQQTVGDTTYYIIPTPILPMLMPLESVPVVGHRPGRHPRPVLPCARGGRIRPNDQPWDIDHLQPAVLPEPG